MDNDTFFDMRSKLLNLMAKFKEICDEEGRNFKVEIDDLFIEVD